MHFELKVNYLATTVTPNCRKSKTATMKKKEYNAPMFISKDRDFSLFTTQHLKNETRKRLTLL